MIDIEVKLTAIIETEVGLASIVKETFWDTMSSPYLYVVDIV
jgi:hypothetical protein